MKKNSRPKDGLNSGVAYEVMEVGSPIPESVRQQIASNLVDLNTTHGGEILLHTRLDDISWQEDLLKIRQTVWMFSIPIKNPLTDPIREESTFLVDPRVIGLWRNYGARGTHSAWESHCEEQVAWTDPELPSEVLDAWRNLLELNYQDWLLECFEKSENDLDSHPAIVKEIFLMAKKNAKKAKRNSARLKKTVQSAPFSGGGPWSAADIAEFTKD